MSSDRVSLLLQNEQKSSISFGLVELPVAYPSQTVQKSYLRWTKIIIEFYTILLNSE